MRVEQGQASRRARVVDAAACFVEASHEEPQVRLGGDQDRRFAREQARSDEVGDPICERCVGIIEVDRVVAFTTILDR